MEGKKAKVIDMKRLELYKKRQRIPEEVAIRGHYGSIDITHIDAEKDTIVSHKLYPGVGVVYPAAMRYANAPPDAITVDMFDASLPEIAEAGRYPETIPRMVDHNREGARGMTTTTLLREELPVKVQEKLATLDVVLASLREPASSFSFCIGVPGVGLAFATGARWVILTEEDCRVDSP